LIGLALLPGHSDSIFSGMPLNNKTEFLTFIFIISFSFGLLLIKKINFKINRSIALLLFTVSLLLPLKFYLFKNSENKGFKACYRSLINELPQGKCEFSTDYFFNKGNFTRYDETIDFNSTNWNLGFWNELRFNIYQTEGNQIRERNPFEVTWSGDVALNTNSIIEVEYTGEGKLKISNSEINLPAHYKSKAKVRVKALEEIIKTDDTLVPIELYYKFQDFSKIGMPKDVLGPTANIKAKLIEGTKEQLLKPHLISKTNSNLKTTYNLLDLFIATLLLLVIISHGVLIYKEKKILFIMHALLIVFYLINFSFNILDISSLFYDKYKSQDLDFSNISTVFYKSPGSDALTYESYARNMLKKDTVKDFLRGEVDVFYYQPGFRYLLALMHVLFGDGDRSIIFFWQILFLISLFFIFDFFSRKIDSTSFLIFSSLFVLVFVKAINKNIVYGSNEPSSWLFLIFAIYFLFSEFSYRRYLLGIVLLALSSIIRINYLPGCIFIIVVFYLHLFSFKKADNLFRKNLIFIGISLFLFISIYSLIPFHNYYYGHKFVFATTAGLHPKTLIFPPSKLLNIFNDISVITFLLEKLKYIFLRPPFLYYSPFYIFWLVSFGYNLKQFVKNKNLQYLANILLLIVPLIFFLPNIFYVAGRRHIVAGHLMLYLLTTYTLSGLIKNLLDNGGRKTGMSIDIKRA
jgi:hypothetical protein